jgi:hypothetical protein
MKTVAMVAKEYLESIGEDAIDYGNQLYLCEIYKLAKLKWNPDAKHYKNHPMNRTKRVLDAIDRNSQSDKPLFKKSYYMAHRMVRLFTLIK